MAESFKTIKISTDGQGARRREEVDAVTEVATVADNSGGTDLDDHIDIIGVTYDQAEVRNAVATLAAKVNSLTAACRNAGIVDS